MFKTGKRPMLDSDSEESANDEVTQKKKEKLSSSGTSSEESDDDWTSEAGIDEKKKNSKVKGGKLKGKKVDGNNGGSSGNEKVDDVTGDSSGSSSSGTDDDDDDGDGDDSSSSDDETPTFNDGYGEDMTIDEEDRQKLASMTEAEREQEIFKRLEERDILKARFEVEMKLHMEKKQEKKLKRLEKKSKNRQRSLRTKEPKQTKTTQAIVELKATRIADKQKKAEAEKKQQLTNTSAVGIVRKEPLKVSDVFTSGSSDGSDDSNGSDEDDDEEAEEEGDISSDIGQKSLAQLKSENNRPISTIEELSKIKISRFRLEKWVHMPFFGDVIKGCYIRVGIGQNEGRMVYRVCEVVGVHETPKVYSLGSTKTNKGLKLRFGKQERVFRMEYVSNSAFTEQEFTKWKSENEAHSIRLPTVFEIDKKVREIEKRKNTSLKEEDIDQIIIEKQKFRKNPHNYALTKNRLLREMEIAQQTGSPDKASSIAKQLEELEERAEELDRQRTKSLSAISYINERNRQRNVERAEEALKNEMATIRDKEEDPFTRRKCMPRLVTFGKDLTADDDKDDILSQGHVSGGIGPDDDDSMMMTNSDVPMDTTSANVSQVDDLFTAHDFDININLPTDAQGPSAIKSTPKSSVTTPRNNDGPRKSLNLSDYKKRRGLI